MTAPYKVVIPTAGLGSRLGAMCTHLNKALLGVDNKPIISHIIEKFPADVPVVVPLGYKGELVREYLALAHPDRRFEFREISPFDGPGSGLGLTLLSVADLLRCPFVFCSNDTIVAGDIPPPDANWMGGAATDDLAPYRTFDQDGDGRVTAVNDKGRDGPGSLAYIGLSGIHDWQAFWAAMEAGRDRGAIETGESFGLAALLPHGIHARPFVWYDTGNRAALERARTALGGEHSVHILEKPDEAIWFVGGRVIKFSRDSAFIANRVTRSDRLQPYVPQVTAAGKSMYAYPYVAGTVLSRQPLPSRFRAFLAWMEGFWTPAPADADFAARFRTTCMAFYRDKTYQRVAQYFRAADHADEAETVNGDPVPAVADLLDALDWEWIADGTATRFHGDLHFENIVARPEGAGEAFTLLDWRQDFGGDLQWGDIYYDLAKLMHGLIVCHEFIDRDLFQVEAADGVATYDLHQKLLLVECQAVLEEWVRRHGYDWKKVQVLTALIFLNICPLHHYPYSKFLLYLGKRMLHRLTAAGG